jgi:hypothetical protein
MLGREVGEPEGVGDKDVGSDAPVHEEDALAGGPAGRADLRRVGRRAFAIQPRFMNVRRNVRAPCDPDLRGCG